MRPGSNLDSLPTRSIQRARIGVGSEDSRLGRFNEFIHERSSKWYRIYKNLDLEAFLGRQSGCVPPPPRYGLEFP